MCIFKLCVCAGVSASEVLPGREGDRSMTMTDRDGRKFICGVPNSSTHASTGEEPDTTAEVRLHPYLLHVRMYVTVQNAW